MKEMKYKLRVSPKYEKEIYRIIEVSGNTTLARLQEIIIAAFGFDDEHLYMFSLKRKKYDQDGFYAPGSECGGRSAARVKLGELGLKPRNKMLFLFDFGDEWEFNVAVSKIIESETKVNKKIIESQGELEQYEYWDEEDDDESSFYENNSSTEKVAGKIGDITGIIDFGLEEDLLQLGKISGLKTEILYQDDLYQVEKCELTMEEVLQQTESKKLERLCAALTLKVSEEQQQNAKALANHYGQKPENFLGILTAEDIEFLHRLLKKDYRGLMKGYYVSSPAWHLQALGLIRISAEEIFYFEIVEDIDALKAAVEHQMQERELEKECQVEQIFRALLRLYAVIEKEDFRYLVSDCAQWEVDEVYFEQFLVKQNLFWERLFCYKDKAGNHYYSWYEEKEISQQVLDNRQKYKVSRYEKFDQKYCIGLIRDRTETTIWCKRLVRELKPYAWGLTLADCIVEDIEDFVRIGCDEDEFLDKALDFLREFEISWTQKIRETLKKVHNTYPSGGLKGHNWYDNSRNDGSSQISMFGDLPFFSI
ncbi:MAG: plasmid pRiA4b ORF-3 family protein [Acetobacterium sp.]|nr:plasmid pRiA4b ORF-3 family protein [Acetobacterium sp.]